MYIFLIIDDFKEILSHTTLNQLIPFDFESDFVTNLFGKDKQRQINYQEFSQIIHVLFNLIFIKKYCSFFYDRIFMKNMLFRLLKNLIYKKKAIFCRPISRLFSYK